jgi:hypothetical protein
MAMASAQDGKKPARKENDYHKIFTKIENEANTDPVAFQRYIAKHMSLPDSIAGRLSPEQYTVTVSFVIDKYGRMEDVKAENAADNPLAAMAVKIIRNYPGKWTPANQCGVYVKSYKKQKIIFHPTEE